MTSIELKKPVKPFVQVCVWEGTLVATEGKETTPEKIEEFEAFFVERFGTRVQYIAEIKTGPNIDGHGNPVKGTGGRNDVFFSVHEEDVGKFAVPRLTVGIRWIEDVLARDNYRHPIYPDGVFALCSWYCPKVRPEVTLAGTDGNVFNLIALVSKEMKSAGLGEDVDKMQRAAMNAPSYEHVMAVFLEYVDLD